MPNRRRNEREKKKQGKRNTNVDGSSISCCLAQSHIDSLHSTELFLRMCPAVSHTAASGTPAVLKLAIPSEIKKEKARAQGMRGGNMACNTLATHSWAELPVIGKEYMTVHRIKRRLKRCCTLIMRRGGKTPENDHKAVQWQIS